MSAQSNTQMTSSHGGHHWNEKQQFNTMERWYGETAREQSWSIVAYFTDPRNGGAEFREKSDGSSQKPAGGLPSRSAEEYESGKGDD